MPCGSPTSLNFPSASLAVLNPRRLARSRISMVAPARGCLLASSTWPATWYSRSCAKPGQAPTATTAATIAQRVKVGRRLIWHLLRPLDFGTARRKGGGDEGGGDRAARQA